MVHALAALLLFLAASVSATSSHIRRQRAHQHSHPARNRTYTLQDVHQGPDFFDGFNFFDGDDPTHGYVDYLSRHDAMANNLTYVRADNTSIITVDTSDTVPRGGLRKSVRISSKKAYNRGLFIADIQHIPQGCSVWPAFWTLGTGRDKQWPNNGEIDIIEQINLVSRNQVTMHSGPSSFCAIDEAVHQRGRIMSTECSSSHGNNVGCAVLLPEGTFGAAMNRKKVGVYAWTLEADGIKVWFWPRGEVPQDVTDQEPKPETWGAPTAFLAPSLCDNILDLFFGHQIIINIDICGDWAGGDNYKTSGCPAKNAGDTCEDAVANPRNFKYAWWGINYVSVYQ